MFCQNVIDYFCECASHLIFSSVVHVELAIGYVGYVQ